MIIAAIIAVLNNGSCVGFVGHSRVRLFPTFWALDLRTLIGAPKKLLKKKRHDGCLCDNVMADRDSQKGAFQRFPSLLSPWSCLCLSSVDPVP